MLHDKYYRCRVTDDINAIYKNFKMNGQCNLSIFYLLIAFMVLNKIKLIGEKMLKSLPNFCLLILYEI